jgi:6-phosphogluconolactonase
MNKLLFGLSVVLASACALLTAGAASAASGVVGHVYVNDNTGGVNTSGAFDRHADGTLTPMRGSPFVAGGVGTGEGLASQGSLQRSSDGRYLLAADAASKRDLGAADQVRRLAEASRSSCLLERRQPGQHCRARPPRLRRQRGHHHEHRRNELHRLHAQPWRPAATAARLDGHAPRRLPAGRRALQPRRSQARGDPRGDFADRQLPHRPRRTARRGSRLPFAAQGLGPFGSEFRPTNAAQLYVSNAHNMGAGTGTVSAFAVGSDGALTSIGASPFPNNQTAPCWVEISHDGQYLFAVNTASGSISSYSIATGGSLTLLRSTPVKAAGTPEDARLSPDGNTLWVVDPTANHVSGFAVNGGRLTELPTSPTPAPVGAAPAGIVVTNASLGEKRHGGRDDDDD